MSTTPDTVVLRLDERGQTARVAVATMSRLDLSQGMRRRTGAGLGRGLLAGVVIGAAAGYAACSGQRGCKSSNTEMNSPQFYMMATGLAGGVLGGLVGAVIGSSIRRESWTTVPRANWHVRATPTLDGMFAVSASRRF